MGLPYFCADNFSNIKHGFFTRKGGVSIIDDYASLNCGLATNDDIAKVKENRKLIIEALTTHKNINKLHSMQQMHGTDVAIISKDDTPNFPKVDALITANSDIILAVLTADCAPVLLVDDKNKVIAAVHAGWRSAFGGIIQNTIDKMQAIGAKIDCIKMAIGPCIGQKNYEIDKNFYDIFINQSQENHIFFKDIPNKKGQNWLFNLQGYVKKQAHSIGIENISSLKNDTYNSENMFFSHRRHMNKYGHGNCGRQLSVIML